MVGIFVIAWLCMGLIGSCGLYAHRQAEQPTREFKHISQDARESLALGLTGPILLALVWWVTGFKHGLKLPYSGDLK